MSSDNQIQNNRTSEQIQQMKNQKEAFLNLRRKKLSEMLMTEDAYLKREIMASQDTPELQKKKMEKKLNELKTIRELERQKIVKQLQEKCFIENQDMLRKNESDYVTMACYLEQENQMLDKLHRREEEKRQEQMYSLMNRFDMEQKRQREIKEQREEEEKNQKLVDYLNHQKQENIQKFEELNRINEIEKQKLKEQWKMDEQNELDDKLRKLELNKQVNRDIEQFNIIEKQQRELKDKIEKEHDKELVQRQLMKEHMLDEIDKQEKERRKAELVRHQAQLAYAKNKKKEEEDYLDKLADEERERQYQKEYQKWLKEEEARIELLKQVYQDRANALFRKAQIEQDEKQQIMLERQILDEEIKNYNKKVQEFQEAERQRLKVHQQELDSQIKEKETIRTKEKQQDLYERRMAELIEMEYQNKLNEQNEIHMKKLLELKRKGIPEHSSVDIPVQMNQMNNNNNQPMINNQQNYYNNPQVITTPQPYYNQQNFYNQQPMIPMTPQPQPPNYYNTQPIPQPNYYQQQVLQQQLPQQYEDVNYYNQGGPNMQG